MPVSEPTPLPAPARSLKRASPQIPISILTDIITTKQIVLSFSNFKGKKHEKKKKKKKKYIYIYIYIICVCVCVCVCM